MKTERIVLDQARGVVLYAYLNHWTSATFGDYPRRSAVIVCPGGAFMVHAGSEGEPIAMAFAGRATRPSCSATASAATR